MTGNSLPLFSGCILIMALRAWVFHLWYHTLQSGMPQSPTQGSDKTTGDSEAEEHVPALCVGLLWGLLMKGLGKNEDHYDTVNTTGALLWIRSQQASVQGWLGNVPGRAHVLVCVTTELSC